MLTGNAKPILQALQQKADKWLMALWSNFLPCHLLWTMVHHILWPFFHYPLSVMSLNSSQEVQTVSKLYQVLLPQLGMNCHFPMVLRYALPQHHGLGLPNPYWEQGISRLHLFLEHANSTSSKGILIHASLEFLQLELGMHTNLFLLPYDTWNFLATDCWIKMLWYFVDTSNLKLQSISSNILLPLCQHDGSIMADALSANLPKSSIQAINHCHITHQAFYWSDVANSWGNSIFPSCLHPPASTLLSSWKWPPEKPVHLDWAIWSTFLKNSPHVAAGHFVLPLGPRPLDQTNPLPQLLQYTITDCLLESSRTVLVGLLF